MSKISLYIRLYKFVFRANRQKRCSKIFRNIFCEVSTDCVKPNKKAGNVPDYYDHYLFVPKAVIGVLQNGYAAW